MAYIKGRRGISPRQIYTVLLIVMLGTGISAGVWVSGSWIAAIVTAEFTFVGLVIGGLIIRRLIASSLRRALVQRGIAVEQQVTFRITADTLVYEQKDFMTTANWSCVTDMYRTRKYWVFLVQSSAFVLPRRFFATSEAERDFIAKAIAHMTDAARARSPDAAKIAA